MDNERFDDLTRGLAHGLSRRTVLRGVAASGVASALALLGVRDSAAACLGNGVRCGPNTLNMCKDCCSANTRRQNNGQRRCACRRDVAKCNRSDQCCSNRCIRFEAGRSKRCAPSFFPGFPFPFTV